MSKENKNTITIFGKEYMPVASRINQLAEDTDGNYSIITAYDLEHYPVVIVTATLTIGENTFTGHALGDLSDADFGKKVKGKILETISTHAIGRSLAASGRNGGELSEFASADEMLQNGDSNYQDKPATEKQINFIKKLCDKVDANHDEYVTDKMTMTDASDRIEKLQNIAQDLESNYQSEPTTDNEEIPF